jgi:hypothetical protein
VSGLDIDKDDGGHLLRDTVCYEGKNCIVESISDSLFCHLGTPSTGYLRRIQEISEVLWNSPPSVVFRNTSERVFDISVITIPQCTEKIDSSAWFSCEVAFAIDGDSRGIHRFNWRRKILKVDIPGSVDII